MEVDVSIVMPCLNEAESLPFAIASAQKALAALAARRLTGEILVADNGSTDGSQEIARQHGCEVVHCPTRGYGNALIQGISQARGRYIIMGDADASYDFTESPPMVEKLQEGFDLCMGSRFRGAIQPGAMPWKNRYIGNPILTKTMNLLLGSGISDVFCGLRAFTRDAYDVMMLKSAGMNFALEMVAKASLLQLRRTEVPITLSPDHRKNGNSCLKPWRDGWSGMKLILSHSPLWLFFVPALAMLCVSSLIFLALLVTPPQQSFTLGFVRLGDHWMILAAGGFFIGYQLFIFGINAAIMHDPQNNNQLIDKIIKLATLENAIIVSASLILGGMAIVGYVVSKWIAGNYGPLFEYRQVIIGTILMVVGVQTFFAGFMFSVFSENMKK
jgi:glycosyltransferase involved in cell wall biosynthesis